MNNAAKYLTPKPLKTTKKGDKLTADLKEKNVSPEKLAVVMVGNEQFIGEVEVLTIQEPTVIKNPKRFARFQQVSKNPDGTQGVAINFMIGDLDLVEEGTIAVCPSGGYFLSDLGESSIESFLNLYNEFLVRKEANNKIRRAQEAGLALPNNMGQVTKATGT